MIEYKKKRVNYSDDTWADVVTVRFPAKDLRFKDIVLLDHATRVHDANHLRYVKAQLRGVAHPYIVGWACLEHDEPASKMFPNINHVTDSGEHLLSTNSLVTYTMRTLLSRGWLEFDGLRLNIPENEQAWHDRAKAIIDWLKGHERLHVLQSPQFEPKPTSFNAQLDSVPVGRAGFLRRFVDAERYDIAFNTSYFLLEPDDFFSHHSALGAPYNLAVYSDEIVRPPLYRRAVFWCDANDTWHTSHIGMDDMQIVFSHELDWTIEFDVNPNDAGKIAVYTRYLGVASQGRVIGHTPQANRRIEFTVIDRQIVGWKRDGSLTIPQNGFVLSFAKLDDSQIESLIQQQTLTYQFKSEQYQSIKEAIQCGPILIQNGESVLSNDVFEQEQFWISRNIKNEWVNGVVPSDYPTDVDMTRAGRVGLGINDQQEIIVVAISGVNSGYNHENTDSSGATLVELTDHLLDAGAIEAMNLDGGGSTQLFIEGGLATQPGDRRGLLGILYERMIPSAGVASPQK